MTPRALQVIDIDRRVSQKADGQVDKRDIPDQPTIFEPLPTSNLITMGTLIYHVIWRCEKEKEKQEYLPW